MPLILRLTPDCMVRSVDDRPGVVGAGMDTDGFTLTIDTSFEPSADAQAIHAAAQALGASGTISEGNVRTSPDFPEHITRLDITDAVAAAEGPEVLSALASIAASMIPTAVDLARPHWEWELIRACAQFAIEVRDSASVRLEELAP